MFKSRRSHARRDFSGHVTIGFVCWKRLKIVWTNCWKVCFQKIKAKKVSFSPPKMPLCGEKRLWKMLKLWKKGNITAFQNSFSTAKKVEFKFFHKIPWRIFNRLKLSCYGEKGVSKFRFEKSFPQFQQSYQQAVMLNRVEKIVFNSSLGEGVLKWD